MCAEFEVVLKLKQEMMKMEISDGLMAETSIKLEEPRQGQQQVRFGPFCFVLFFKFIYLFIYFCLDRTAEIQSILTFSVTL